MKDITYHKATIDDVHTLVKNRIDFAVELKGGQSEEKTETLRIQMTDYFLRATADGSCISFIARCDNKVAGIGSVHIREMPGNFINLSGRWGYIMNMYTLPAFRRMGVCTGILNALVEEAGRSGITAFELHATKEGEMVYIQNGFKIHNEPNYRKFISI